MQSRRDQLLDAALGYCLKHGLANLSLRPLAEEIGTSARLLVFHFKSKDALIGDVLEALNKRLRASFEEVMASAGGPTEPPLRRIWNWASSKEALPSLRLYYELQIVAAQNPKRYRRYVKKMSLSWLNAATGALSAETRSENLATLCIAIIDGLLIELISTGDRDRLTRALDAFIAMARAAAADRA